MPAKVSWTAVRVSKDTKDQLEQLRQLWSDLVDRTKDPIGSDATRSGQEAKRDVIGLDQVIRRLIRYHQAHNERSKKSAAKRRNAKQERTE